MISETDFPFLAEKGHIVSLVGGGGKTTLLYAMAAHCAQKGWRVLVMTTTHILCPEDGTFVQNRAQAETLWASGKYAVLGTPTPENKLTLPEPELLAALLPQADAVFIEADGARHHPCKAPAAHEPVLLPQSDIVLALAGLSALGHPLQEICFRWELACTWLQITPETQLSPRLLARLLADKRGGRKTVGARQFYAVLNQADTKEACCAGREVQAILQQDGVQSVLTHFAQGERA